MEHKTPDDLPELTRPANTWVDDDAPKARPQRRRRGHGNEDGGRVEFDPSSRGDESGEVH
jgi:hypothetical protein